MVHIRPGYSLGIKVIKNSRVGYNLMNHPISLGATFNLTRSSNVPRSKEEWLSDVRQYAKTHDEPLSAAGISQLSGYIPSSDATDDYPDLKFGFAFSDISTEGADIPASYYSRIKVGHYHVRPKGRGFLTINSADPFDPPLVYPMLSLPTATGSHAVSHKLLGYSKNIVLSLFSSYIPILSAVKE
jgi:hypothetical protein